MAGTFLKQGLETAMDGYLGSVDSGWRVRLYQDNIVPDVDTNGAALTEASFSGYAAAAGLTPTPAPAWNAVTKKWVATWGTFTFAGSGGGTNQNVYLAGITDAAGQVQLLKRLTSAPVFMGPSGTSLQLTPTVDDLVE